MFDVMPGFGHITRQEPLQYGNSPIVLILSPARKLAQQTSQVCQNFAQSLGIRQSCVFGGVGLLDKRLN
jgi:superfamily II DNA/RNA helicase